MKLLKKIFLCWTIGFHDWTCKAEQGIPPSIPLAITNIDGETHHDGVSPEELERQFWEYAKMYCKTCGKVSNLSKR